MFIACDIILIKEIFDVAPEMFQYVFTLHSDAITHMKMAQVDSGSIPNLGNISI